MRRLRYEDIFERWIEDRRLKFHNQSFTSFKDRCDAGEIEGLSPYDWRRGQPEQEPEHAQGDG